MNPKIVKGRKVKSEKFAARKNQRVAKRRSGRRMSLRKSQKSKLVIQMIIHPANVVARREKRKKRSLHKLLLLQ